MTINRNNFEEYFLLYIDRELSGDERQMVEEFVRWHPDLEKELDVLKETITVPQEIVFEHKEKLLRDEKVRRLFPFYRWHIAAAILVVLAGACFLVMTVKIRKSRPATANSGEMAIKTDTEHGSTAARKTDNGKNPASVKKKDEESLLSGHLEKAGMPVVRQQSRSHLLSPDSNPVKIKIDATAEKQVNPDPAIDLPGVAQNKIMTITTNLPSIPSGGQRTPLPVVSGQPSANQPSFTKATEGGAANPPSGLRRVKPSAITDQPSTTQSILVFDNKNKTVSGFFKKVLSGSPEDATAENHRQRIRINVFQFNLKK